jgi:NADPH:quinone reductase-like Zn-dependent oxidoreductase
VKAATFHAYGPPDVLHVENVPQPVPQDDEVLIRVHATPVNFADLLVRNFRAVGPREFHMPFLFWLLGRLWFGLRKPRVSVLGSEFSGLIEEVGKGARRFARGDAVFGYCGPRMGADAEYLRMKEHGLLTHKPRNMSHEEAASVPYGAMLALDLLGRLDLQPGARLLVNGASGGIGPLVLQIAKRRYHATVTGVCSTAKIETVRSLGADEVIDYTRQDFVESGRTYDVIIDILGKSSFERVRRVLAPRGRLVYVSFKEKQILQMLATALGGGPKVVCAVLQERRENLALARELIEAGQIRASIDRVFPLAQAAEAHRYAQSGARKGTVVLGIAASASATSSGGVESRRGSVSDAKRVGNASHLTETSYEAV